MQQSPQKQSLSLATVLYGLLAIAGAIGTWSYNLRYIKQGHSFFSASLFSDLFANPASSSFTVDLLVVTLMFAVFVICECRRLHMKGAVLYLIAAVLIALAFSFPLFLALRQRTLERQSVLKGPAPIQRRRP
ncbi:hypothetical protein ABB02_01647 [Clostridiaceae bacterium JG1575]|nr:hypothetical protein ABB02_01647 [Clostridiaceae bacterium JG1575]